MKLLITAISLFFCMGAYAQSVDVQPAFIKNIIKQNGQTVLILDYVELRLTGDLNDFKIINNNTKLRSFVVDKNCRIDNCSPHKNITLANLLQNKNKLITSGSKQVLVFVTVRQNVVSYLNIECVN